MRTGEEKRNPVRVQTLADGVRFFLPPPGMRAAKVSGWISLVLANILLIGAATGVALIPSLSGGSTGLAMPLWVIVSIATAFGLLLLASGLSRLFGVRTIDITADQLILRRHVGGIGVTRRIRLQQIESLSVTLAYDRNDKHVAQNSWKGTCDCSLISHLRRGRARRLVRWVTLEYARALGTQVGKAIEAARAERGETKLVPLRIDPIVAGSDEEDGEAPEPPASTDVEIDASDGELSIVVPRLPVTRAFGGQSTVAVAAQVTGAGAAAALLYFGVFGGPFSWFWMMFLFPAVGAWGYYLYDRVSSRETYIDVVGDSLLVSRQTFRRVRQWSWSRDEIRLVRCGESGLEVNHRPVPQLEIRLADGTHKKLFIGRSREELAWIAWHVRQALHLHEPVKAGSDEAECGHSGAGARIGADTSSTD